MNMLLKRMIFVEMALAIKRRILLGLIFMFVISIAFIPCINQPAFAFTYTKVTGGTASARSQDPSYPASKSFDSSTGTYWKSITTSEQGAGPPPSSWPHPSEYVQYHLSSPKIVTRFRFHSPDYIVDNGYGNSISLGGSNNGSTWTQLYFSSSSYAQNQWHDFTISNTTSYTYYRFFLNTDPVCQGLEYYPGFWIWQCYYAVRNNELELYTTNPPSTPPGTPSGPATDADGYYTISWTAVGDATSYQLQENYNGGGWSTVYNSSGTSTTRSGRSPGTWNYRVTACNVGGCSGYSGTRTVLVAPPVPGTPSGPTGTEYDGAYTISWNAVTGASSYQLQERLNSGTWSTIYNSSGTSVSRSGRGVGTWSYRVMACGSTCSAYSGTKSVTVAVPPVPATPSGPATDYVGSYTISWSAVTGATSYILRENLNGDGWSTVYNSSGTSTTRSGRTLGTWNYQVSACSAVGCSAYSGTKSVSVIAPAPPATPSGPATDADGAYTISWSGVTGATGYRLQENLNSGTWSEIYNSTGTSKSISGRGDGTWNYRLQACSAVGCSGYSGIKSVQVVLDLDNDGFADSWENQYCGSLIPYPTNDTDSDGLLDSAEFTLGTHPCNADTDGDGINDGIEEEYGGDPSNPNVMPDKKVYYEYDELGRIKSITRIK